MEERGGTYSNDIFNINSLESGTDVKIRERILNGTGEKMRAPWKVHGAKTLYGVFNYS